MSGFSLMAGMVALATISFQVFGLTSAGDAVTNQLIFIGNIEGKSYFADGSTTVTWEQANSYCNTSAMHLATVTSVAQQKLLMNAHNNVTFNFWHWTGGRDSLDRKPSQFVWQVDGEVLNSTVVSPIEDTVGIQNCIAFSPLNQTFHIADCSGTYRILCELIYDK